jgi:hypothetical protein
MSIDSVVLKKIKEKLSDKNQSEELINDLVDFIKDKDLKQINIEEKNQLIERILEKINL